VLLVCTVCDGLGYERRCITHPMSNVAGWMRETSASDWWRRRCDRCDGSGFCDGSVSVPTVPPIKITRSTSMACTRQPGLTQYCTEAAEAHARVAELERMVRRLVSSADNPLMLGQAVRDARKLIKI
jgi:hypothetical protein